LLHGRATELPSSSQTVEIGRHSQVQAASLSEIFVRQGGTSTWQVEGVVCRFENAASAKTQKMIKITACRKAPYHQAIVAGLALAMIGISRVQAQDEEVVGPNNPAIGAEVLQLSGLQDLGRRSNGAPVEVLLGLRFNHAGELNQLVQEQSDRNSSNYHRYLTSEQFAERFGPTLEQLNRVTNELEKAGFQVTKISANRLLVHAIAPSVTVESYFKTEIHTVRQDSAVDRYMNVKAALLPDALIPLVKAIHIDNLVVAKVGASADGITGPIQGPDQGFTPVALANCYDFPVQHGKGGKGHTAATIIDSDILDSDLNAFFAYFPITRTGTITHESVDGGIIGSTSNGTDFRETALDTETIGGLAPGADIIIYVLPALTDVAINDAANQIITDKKAEVVNMSFGGGENSDPTFASILKEGNAKGITFVASSGDNGSSSGDGNGVQWPAVEPRVLALGGTVLSQSSGKYVRNQAWSGSGGGVSAIVAIPTYQKGVSGEASKTHRNVPDLAFPSQFADIYAGGIWLAFGGTSWSSPIYVALQLEVNQVQGSRFGWVNPSVYSLFKSSGYANFYDVTNGSNGTYNAKKGYDNVTGIGSPRGQAFANNL
jgi:kumamolisin